MESEATVATKVGGDSTLGSSDEIGKDNKSKSSRFCCDCSATFVLKSCSLNWHSSTTN